MADKTDKTVNFNDYIETYQKEIQSSIDFIGKELDFFIQLKAKIIIHTAQKYFPNPDTINILDIGCGIGLTEHYLAEFFHNMQGVDVDEKIVQKAKQFNPTVKYSSYDGMRLPFDDGSMDFVFAINVIHHIKPENWGNFFKEIHRVVKTGGVASIFEHNPLNPLTRIAVSRCVFDRDATLLRKNTSGKLFKDTNFKIIDSAYIFFFPFKNKLFRNIENIIRWLPFGAQYFITATK